MPTSNYYKHTMERLQVKNIICPCGETLLTLYNRPCPECHWWLKVDIIGKGYDDEYYLRLYNDSDDGSLYEIKTLLKSSPVRW